MRGLIHQHTEQEAIQAVRKALEAGLRVEMLDKPNASMIASSSIQIDRTMNPSQICMIINRALSRVGDGLYACMMDDISEIVSSHPNDLDLDWITVDTPVSEIISDYSLKEQVKALSYLINKIRVDAKES